MADDALVAGRVSGVMSTRMVRRGLAVALAAGILALTGSASAAGAPTTPPISSASRASVDDRDGAQFHAGAVIDVAGEVDGDVYAAGQTVTISGVVTGDVIAAAQTIDITGTVEGDVRLAAQDASITGQVAGSATVFAASMTVSESGTLGTDLVTAANTATIAGEVGRDVYATVGRLAIDGSVGRDVTYVSEREARIAGGSVDGAVKRIDAPDRPRIEISPVAVVLGWLLGVFYALIALSLIALFAGLLFPRWLHRTTDHLVPSPWKALLVGFVASVAVPLALALLAVTVVGAPLALVLAVAWLLMVLATFVIAAFYLGRIVFRDRAHPAVMSLVGAVTLTVALQIPWLNIVVWFAVVFFGLGAELLEIQRLRPWHREHVSPAPPPEPASAAGAPREGDGPLAM